MVKKIDTERYALDITIPWSDLNKIWNETKKVKGIKAWFRYVWNYQKYASLANFGAKVVNVYHIPFKQIGQLYSEEKK